MEPSLLPFGKLALAICETPNCEEYEKNHEANCKREWERKRRKEIFDKFLSGSIAVTRMQYDLGHS